MGKQKIDPKKKVLYKEISDTVIKVAESKGWNTSIQNRDTNTFKYISVHVRKYFDKDYSSELVTGNVEIDINPDNSVRLQIEKTSFYGYGIDSLTSSLKAGIKELPLFKTIPKELSISKSTPIEIVEQILNRFERSVRQLRRRYDNRPTIDAKDEYDIQDILHTILKCYFEDVRPEEYCPSYAGSSSRIDFLLKKERIIIEAKYSTSKLKDKKIGEQLIIDIKRYETHPDCDTLFCFVYDPDGNINNPVALENDLSGQHGKNNFKVKVVISPK